MRITKPYGFFSVDPMPNQPSVGLCYDFTIFPDFRAIGRASALKWDQLLYLKQTGFTLGLCTVQQTNLVQQRVLMKAGWRLIQMFPDIRTGNNVMMYSIDVNYEFKKRVNTVCD